MPAHPFIQRWQNSGAAERANYQMFFSELCDFLDLPRPNPAVADDRQNDYVFDRPVTFRHPSGETRPGFRFTCRMVAEHGTLPLQRQGSL